MLELVNVSWAEGASDVDVKKKKEVCGGERLGFYSQKI